MTVIATLPDVHLQSVSFDPVQVRQTDRMEGRRSEELIHPQTWWTASYQTELLDRRDLGRMEAFMMLAGAGAVFRAHDAERPRPLAHDNGQPLAGTRAAGGAFDGTASLTAIAATQVTVAGLPAGFQFLAGDYVELHMAPLLVTLHRIVADVAASAEGIAILQVRYAIDLALFTLAATVNFETPSCLMKLEPGSYSAPKANAGRRASFAAQEYFPEVVE